MIRALIEGELREAQPGMTATCPSCGAGLVAKCGQLVQWHWAHRADDCDTWYEPMSAWHRQWQERAPVESREVVMSRGDQTHRADVVLPSGFVLELQASPIGADEIRAREAFYGKMLWLFNAAAWVGRLHFGKRGFWWKHGATSQAEIAKPLFWDVGDQIWQVKLGRGEKEVSRYDEKLDRFVYEAAPSNRVIGKVERRWTHAEFIRDAFGGPS